jgi:hypothetical protein
MPSPTIHNLIYCLRSLLHSCFRYSHSVVEQLHDLKFSFVHKFPFVLLISFDKLQTDCNFIFTYIIF